MRAEPARRLVVLGVEARVLVQRLAVDGLAVRARLADGVHALLGRGVHEVHGRAHRARQRHRAAEGEQLGQLGVDEVQVRAVHPPFGAEALVVELHEVFVLAVYDHQAPGRRDLLHEIADPAEVEAIALPLGMRRQHVGGEDLEARIARADRLGNLLEDLQIEVAGHRDVVGVVDVRVALPPGRALLDGGLDAVDAGAHVDEIDVGRRPAPRHAAGVVFRPQRRRRLIGMTHDGVGQVRVGIDPARRHDQAGGVDHPRALARQRARQAQRDDLLALDADLPGAGALGSHDLSVGDHGV